MSTSGIVLSGAPSQNRSESSCPSTRIPDALRHMWQRNSELFENIQIQAPLKRNNQLNDLFRSDPPPGREFGMFRGDIDFGIVAEKPHEKPSLPLPVVRRAGGSVRRCQRLDKQKPHHKASDDVDAHRRVREIPAVDSLYQLRLREARPASKCAAHGDREIGPHAMSNSRKLCQCQSERQHEQNSDEAEIKVELT